MNPAVEHILKFFTYSHLPHQLQCISKPFCELAHALALGDNTPRHLTGTITTGSGQLLEAKDAAVRAALE